MKSCKLRCMGLHTDNERQIYRKSMKYSDIVGIFHHPWFFLDQQEFGESIPLKVS